VANDGGGITGVWDVGAEGGVFTRGQPSKSEAKSATGFMISSPTWVGRLKRGP